MTEPIPSDVPAQRHFRLSWSALLVFVLTAGAGYLVAAAQASDAFLWTYAMTWWLLRSPASDLVGRAVSGDLSLQRNVFRLARDDAYYTLSLLVAMVSLLGASTAVTGTVGRVGISFLWVVCVAAVVMDVRFIVHSRRCPAGETESSRTGEERDDRDDRQRPQVQEDRRPALVAAAWVVAYYVLAPLPVVFWDGFGSPGRTVAVVFWLLVIFPVLLMMAWERRKRPSARRDAP
jgi:hypothetical protein